MVLFSHRHSLTEVYLIVQQQKGDESSESGKYWQEPDHTDPDVNHAEDHEEQEEQDPESGKGKQREAVTPISKQRSPAVTNGT